MPEFSDRMKGVPTSFIREILKVTQQANVISFAGGLPNPQFFPAEALRNAADDVLTNEPQSALQYSNTEGCIELRLWIAQHYQSTFGLSVPAENILITNGSQQGLDLLGKIFLNVDDGVIIEAPAYLGALQSLSMYQPNFYPVVVDADGMDTTSLKSRLKLNQPKLIYTVPDFQNPSGISYTTENRQALIDVVNRHETILIEDSPYAELRYRGQHKPLLYSLAPDKTVLLGSFSKTLSPSLRLGWVVANAKIMKQLRLAKQAADLHTSYLLQRIVLQYLRNNPYHEHIQTISKTYKQQKQVMLTAIREYFPTNVTTTDPEGGMFLWARLIPNISAQEVFKQAIKNNVAFVPGDAFYYTDPERNTMRLNYTSASEQNIIKGIKILGKIITNDS